MGFSLPQRSRLGDFMGAFADGGVLFPLLLLLAIQGAFSTPVLFGSAGIAYLVSGWFFKIPMSVQPLKAIAIAAIGLGASGPEIRLSGALLGIICLLMTFVDLDPLVKRVPYSLVHCVQAGLGVILMIHGLSILSNITWVNIWLVFILCILLLFFSNRPFLGLVAVLGLVAGWLFPNLISNSSVNHIGLGSAALGHDTGSGVSGGASHGIPTFRILMVISLVLPQLALTLTNSVVAAANVAKHYYGERAYRVSERNLLLSIGFGNIISSLVGGLPYCHGSGGLTAHYRGGSRTWLSNGVIGVFLIAVAIYSYTSGRLVVIGFPNFILSSLLIIVGVFHVYLAHATWRTQSGKYQLILAAIAALLTQNMLIVLAVGFAAEIVRARFFQGQKQGVQSG